MKNRIHRAIATLLAVLLVATPLPAFASAREATLVAPIALDLPKADTADTGDVVFVKFADSNLGADDLATLAELGVEASNVTVGRDGMAAIEVPEGSDPALLVQRLAEDPVVDVAAHDVTLTVLEGPNDDFYQTLGRTVTNKFRGNQVEMFQRRYLGPQSLFPHSIQLEPLMNLATGAMEPIKVAVLDTGYTAPGNDVATGVFVPMGNYTVRNPVTGEPTANVDDGHGHGTMVAATIGATTGNAIGIAGAAGDTPVKVLVYKVLRDDGSSRPQGALDINEAIMDAVDAGAKIINLSFGDTSAGRDDLGQAFRPAIDYAVDNGVIIVAAAGNSAKDYVFPPAAAPEVLAVGSIDYDKGTRSPFSNYGRGLDLMATGEDVPVLLPGGGGVAVGYGTSFAAPITAGAVATLWSLVPGASADQVLEAVTAAADPYPVAKADTVQYGAGKLDIYAAYVRLTSVATAAAKTNRLAGADRYGTAVAVSRAQYPGTAAAAVLASGANWPDALTAGVLARSAGGPLLLTRPDSLPSEVRTELIRLAPSELLVVGGAKAVAPEVLDALRQVLPSARVTRIAGASRYDTARAVALEVATRNGAPSAAILASGRNFPDALAAVPLGAKASWPILLADGNRLPGESAAAIQALGVREVIIVGGEKAVGEDAKLTAANTGAVTTASRVAGSTRYATARAIADEAIARGILSSTGIGVATGRSFPDALAGGAYMADLGAPMVLADSMDDGLASWLSGMSDVDKLHVFGGTKGVSEPLTQQIAMGLLAK